jgi:chaperonin GroES
MPAIEPLKDVIVIGDKVLVRPKKDVEKTVNGLYLPPGVQEKEKINYGYVVKVGPGYPISMIADHNEPWQEPREKLIKYIPLQPMPGDLALFLAKQAFEVDYQGERYFILPQSAILLLERQNDLFE